MCKVFYKLNPITHLLNDALLERMAECGVPCWSSTLCVSLVSDDVPLLLELVLCFCLLMVASFCLLKL